MSERDYLIDHRLPRGETGGGGRGFIECLRAASPDRATPLVLFFFLVSVSTTFTVSHYMKLHDHLTFWGSISTGTIIGLDVAGIVAISLLLCLVSAHRDDQLERRQTTQTTWTEWLSKNIKLCGIVPFFFAVVALDIFHLVAVGRCLDAWLLCEETKIRVAHFMEFFYHVARVTFMFFLTMFCWKFTAGGLPSKTGVFFGLALIMAATTALWLDSVADDSELFANLENSTAEVLECLGTLNDSSRLTMCASKTTKEYGILQTASPYLYPFVIEFLILVVECLAGWYFAGGHSDDRPPRPVSADYGEQYLDFSAPNCPWFKMLTTASVISSLIFVAFGIIDFVIIDVLYVKMFIVYSIIYYSTLIVAAAVGFYCALPFLRGGFSPSGFEYFYIACCSGPFAQSVFTIVANLQTSDEVMPTKLSLFCELVNNLEIVAQTFVYFVAKNVDDVRLRSSPGRRAAFGAVLFYFAVCNGALWIDDSFVETRNASQSFQKVYYESWPIIYNITNPITLIYRFNSLLLFLSVYLQHQ